jgi:hypothetical protein
LGDLVGFGLAALLWLEVEKNWDAGPRENMVATFDPLIPAGGLEEMNHGAKAMAMVLRRIEERRFDFLQAGHALKRGWHK